MSPVQPYNHNIDFLVLKDLFHCLFAHPKLTSKNDTLYSSFIGSYTISTKYFSSGVSQWATKFHRATATNCINHTYSTLGKLHSFITYQRAVNPPYSRSNCKFPSNICSQDSMAHSNVNKYWLGQSILCYINMELVSILHFRLPYYVRAGLRPEQDRQYVVSTLPSRCADFEGHYGYLYPGNATLDYCMYVCM